MSGAESHLYAWPTLIPAVLGCVLAVHVWHRRSVPGAGALLAVVACAALWSFGYAMELLSHSAWAEMLWLKAEYVGIAFLPVAWLVFAVRYAGHGSWLARARLRYLVVVPVVTVLLAWTNEWHHLIWRMGVDEAVASGLPWPARYGVWAWVNVVYSYALVIGASVMLWVRLARSRRGDRALYVVVAAAVPLVASVVYTLGLSPLPGLDLTPYGFIVSGFALAGALFRSRLMELAPVAREALIEGMDDGVVVLDDLDRVVDINPAALRLLGVEAGAALRQPLSRLLPEWPELSAACGDKAAPRTEVAIEAGGEMRVVEVHATGLGDAAEGSPLGCLVMLRDVTERRRAEGERERMLAGLRAVLRISDALMACPDLDEVYRRAVELARERLGLGRCSLYLVDGRRVTGTYGTDMQGRTTDERGVSWLDGEKGFSIPPEGVDGAGWTVTELPYSEFDGETTVPAERTGWVASTRVQSGGVPVGVFYNDDAIGETAFDATRQSLVAVYCSVLGNILERKRLEERLARINHDLVELGADPAENINRITALCGTLLGGACALYNRLDRGMLCSPGQWQMPEGFEASGAAEGQVCLDVIREGGDDVVVVRNLDATRYAESDPGVTRYDLRTCVGKAVKLQGEYVGALCVLYHEDRPPTEADRETLGILASAIGLEERRRAALEELQRALANVRESEQIVARSGVISYRWPGGANTFSFMSETVSQWGYSAADVVSGRLQFSQIVHPEDVERVWDEVSRYNAAGAREFVQEYRIVTARGETRWVEDRTWVDQDEQGHTLHHQGVLLDITERKRAEEALAESERLYREAIEATAGVPYVRRVGEEQYSFFGTGVEALLEVKAEDMTASVLPSLIRERVFAGPAETRDYETYRRSFWDGALDTFKADYRIVTPDGVEKWVSDASTAVRDEATGEVVGSLGILQDITDRKRVEEQLRASEERYRLLFDHSPVGVVHYDCALQVTACNPRLAEIVHTPREAVIGLDLARLPDEGVIAALRAPLEGRPGSFEGLNVATPVGVQRVSLRTAPLLDSEGRVVGGIGIVQDVSERVRAQEDLQEALARFEAVIENTPLVAIQGFDRTGLVQHWNRASTAMYGYEAEEALGRRLGSLILFPEGEQSFLATLEEVWTRGEATEPAEWLVRTRDGRELWVYSAMFPIFEHAGVSEVFCMDVDVTDRRRAEDAQRLSAVGQLAAGVAHEFNNLLAAVMLRAELTRPEDAASAQRLVDAVLATGGRGAETCASLMAFARPQVPRREAAAIGEPIDAALALAMPQLEAVEVVVVREWGASGHLVYADRGQLEQVFLNLIINACHAMAARETDEKRELVIRTELRAGSGGAGQVVAVFADSGVGIAPEHLTRVFEPFFTTKGSLGDSTTPGSGLGLSVSHGIITAHGGEMSVESEVGVGTRFEVRLPQRAGVVAGTAAPEEAREARPSPRTYQGKRVLVAEDEPEVRGLMCEALDLSDCKVRSARTTAEAVAALEAEEFDAVVSDLMMPGGGGEEILRVTRAMERPPPVLIVTGKLGEELEDELRALGAAAYVQKPFSLGEFHRAFVGLFRVAEEG